MNNSIRDDGGRALAEALAMNRSLQWLKLAHTDIGPEGASALAEALKTNDTLKDLHLYNNDIGDDGACALAEVLKANNTSLLKLDLRTCGIGNTGACALGGALETNTSLVALFMMGNGVGDNGACALAGALETNRSLRSLGLSYNVVGLRGARALARMLHTNTLVSDLGYHVTTSKRCNDVLRHYDTCNTLCRGIKNEGVLQSIQTLEDRGLPRDVAVHIGAMASGHAILDSGLNSRAIVDPGLSGTEQFPAAARLLAQLSAT